MKKPMFIRQSIAAAISYMIINVITSTFYAYFFGIWQTNIGTIVEPVRTAIRSVRYDMILYFIIGCILSVFYGCIGWPHKGRLRAAIGYAFIVGVLHWFMFDSVSSYQSHVLTHTQYLIVAALLVAITYSIYAYILHVVFNGSGSKKGSNKKAKFEYG